MSETIRDVMAKAAQAIRALRQMRDTDKPRKLDEALTWRVNDELAEQLASEALAGLDAALAVPEIECPACGEVVKQVAYYNWVCKRLSMTPSPDPNSVLLSVPQGERAPERICSLCGTDKPVHICVDCSRRLNAVSALEDKPVRGNIQ